MKIIVAGNYGAKNLGDEMILEGVVKTLKSADPGAKITVMSANPEETAKTHNVEAIYKFPAGIRSFFSFLFKHGKKTRRALKECDYFVLGGGGLFTNLTKRAYFIWAIQAFKAIRRKKPLIMYGQSVGPVKGATRKRIVKKLFNKAVFIAVRDEESKKELKKLGVKKKISLVPDPIFCLDDQKSQSPVHEKKKIIVALRHPANLPEDFYAKLTDFLNWMIEERKNAVSFAVFQTPDDRVITDKIIEGIRGNENVSILPEFQKAEDVLKAFSEADFIIGMRLHSVLAAIKARKPLMAISYAPKVKNFMEYAKLKDLVIDTDITDLKEKYLKLEKNSEKTKEELENFNLRAQTRQKEIEKELRRLFQSS